MKKILEFPELRQVYNYDCGANALQSVLGYYGIDVNEGNIMKLAKTKRSGTNISGIKKVLRYFGLKYKEKKMNIQDLKKHIDKKIPVMITLQAWDKTNPNWEKVWKDGHYVVAIGYDKNKIYFEDPASEEETFLTYKQLNDRWHDIDTKNKKIRNWGIAISRIASAKPIKNDLCTDYKKVGKKYLFKKNRIIHMG